MTNPRSRGILVFRKTLRGLNGCSIRLIQPRRCGVGDASGACANALPLSDEEKEQRREGAFHVRLISKRCKTCQTLYHSPMKSIVAWALVGWIEHHECVWREATLHPARAC